MRKGIIIVLVFIIIIIAAISMDDESTHSDKYTIQSDKTTLSSHYSNDNTTEIAPIVSNKEQSGMTDVTYQPLKNGIYTFKNAKDGRYLSPNQGELSLSSTPKNWELKAKTENFFQIYSENSTKLIDVDNAYIASGTAVKMWQNTGYDAQLWQVSKNKSGTYSILCAPNTSYCLGFENGRAVLQQRNYDNTAQEWNITEQENKSYQTYLSKGEIIELQISSSVTSIIPKSRLAKWVDDLEKAYYSFYELTNFKPYEKIIIVAYKKCTEIGYGYVIDNSNIIHIDKDLLVDDLKKMKARNNDWNFCALHEMGHMFDCNRAWNFEAEVLTDLKVAYVLEANSASAAPAEFDATNIFCGKDIINAYSSLGTDFSKSYDVYALAHRFLKIKNDIGWEPFKQVFHNLQSNNTSYSTATNQKKFETFITLLGNYSGKNIKSYFTQNEWNTIINKTNS